MTKLQWQSPKFRAEYARKKYAKLKKDGLGGRENVRYGVFAERMYAPAVARCGVSAYVLLV